MIILWMCMFPLSSVLLFIPVARHNGPFIAFISWKRTQGSQKKLSSDICISLNRTYTHSLLKQLYIHSLMVLQLLVAPWPFLQFRNYFTQTVELLGRVISPSQGRYLNTGQHKHRTNAHTDIHALSGIRTDDPSVLAGEESSWLWPRGHCGRP
jgi:hypothetical protein